MEKLSSREKALALLDALERYGQGDYIGESISQLEHCLQAAHHASKPVSREFCTPITSADSFIDARDELVIAALLHDIGQIVPLESTREARMELGPSQANVGRVGHEAIGASYLHSLEFSETVSRLVNSHVAAKRYVARKSVLLPP